MNLRNDILSKLQANMFLQDVKKPVLNKYNYKEHQTEVILELKHHIKDCVYSDLFLDQLVQLHGSLYVKINNRYFSYSIKDIYYKLENIINNEIEYLPFNKKSSFLMNRNLYHVHHNRSFYLEQNHIRYLRKKYKNEAALELRLQEICKELPDQNPVLYLVQESLIESFDWTNKTGEWILFQYSNNKFYFIGLALHDYADKNDKRLFKKIRKFLREDF